MDDIRNAPKSKTKALFGLDRGYKRSSWGASGPTSRKEGKEAKETRESGGTRVRGQKSPCGSYVFRSQLRRVVKAVRGFAATDEQAGQATVQQ